jgi:hypothetical protein
MAFKPFSDVEPLSLPIAGKKTYVIQSIWARPYEDGARLELMWAKSAPIPEDPEEQNRLLMGPVWEEMKADGVSLDAMKRAAFTCLVDFRMGRDDAEAYWNSGIVPGEAPAPKGATSTSTGAASTTKPPASTSGTTSRPNARKAKAKRSA